MTTEFSRSRPNGQKGPWYSTGQHLKVQERLGFGHAIRVRTTCVPTAPYASGTLAYGRRSAPCNQHPLQYGVCATTYTSESKEERRAKSLSCQQGESSSS